MSGGHGLGSRSRFMCAFAAQLGSPPCPLRADADSRQRDAGIARGGADGRAEIVAAIMSSDVRAARGSAMRSP